MQSATRNDDFGTVQQLTLTIAIEFHACHAIAPQRKFQHLHVTDYHQVRPPSYRVGQIRRRGRHTRIATDVERDRPDAFAHLTVDIRDPWKSVPCEDISHTESEWTPL